MKSFIKIMLVIIAFAGACVALPITASASGYNPQSAVDYAHQYALNYNSGYNSYKGSGGDCANFASQCLTAGGLSQDATWKPYTTTWLRANELRQYLAGRSDCTGYSTASVNNITIGDLVWSRGSDGTGYGHVMVVTAVSSIGINICGHTQDSYDTYYSTSAMASSIVYHVHINSQPSPTPVPIPSKPTLAVQSSNCLNATILSWNATENTDFYSIRLYDGSGNRIYLRDDYMQTAFSALLPAGNYQAEVCSVKRNYWVTESDRIVFTVTEAAPSHTPQLVSMATAGDRLYKLYACEASWLEDKALAESEGGRLAIINSQLVQDSVYALVHEYNQLVYLGAQGYSNYQWRWVDGSAVEGFTAWDTNKPDNWQGRENCMVMYPSNGSWEDYPCYDTSAKGYVAEFDADSLSVETLITPWLEGEGRIKENLKVLVTYSDGTVIPWSGDYEVTTTETDHVMTVNVHCAGLAASCQVSTKPIPPEPDFSLPEALTEIEESAFENIQAAAISIPDGCKRIRARAFAQCEALRAVYLPKTIVYIDPTAFDGSADVVLYVFEDTPAHWYASAYGFRYEYLVNDAG